MIELPLGIHEGIPAPDYFAQGGVSASDLKAFARSPLHYRNAKANPEPPTEAQVRGTLAHLAILQSELFGEDKSHFVRPDKLSFATKEGKAWRVEHASLPVLTREEHENLLSAREAVFAVPQAAALLSGKGAAEVSVLARHPRTGLTLRCRCDRLTEDVVLAPWVCDIKTVQDVRKFAVTARDFSYDIQCVHYLNTLKLAGVEVSNFVFICAEVVPTNGIFGVRLCTLSDESMRAAEEQWEDELTRFAECQEKDTWPGYKTDIEVLTIPKRWTP